MKLEVGMYVRKKNGRIGKIKEIDERDNVQLWYLLDIKNSNFDVKCEGKHIKKASHNIIDLIEEKDVIKFEYDGTEYICDVYEYSGRKDDLVVCCETDIIHIKEANDRFEIKSIVTKEQFESMSYKVGE